MTTYWACDYCLVTTGDAIEETDEHVAMHCSKDAHCTTTTHVCAIDFDNDDHANKCCHCDARLSERHSR